MSKRAILCYLPPANPQVAKFMATYPRMAPTVPTYFFSDSCDYASLTIPKLKPVKILAPRLSDGYGLQAFIWAVKIAQKLDLDEFLYIETDCGFAYAGWDVEAWKTFDTWPKEPYVLGTPVVIGNWDERDWQMAFNTYVYTYQRVVELPIHVSTHPVKFTAEMHPNGALAIYNTKFVASVFKPLLDGAPLENSPTFDLAVGIYMRQRLKFETFARFAYCKSMYSECGDALCTENERLDWLETGMVAAVHKYTYK